MIGDPTAFFTLVMVAPAEFGFGLIDVLIEGLLVATLDAGESFDFIANGYSDVRMFTLANINPLIDAGAPGFPAAFPTYLEWEGSPATLVQTALPVEPTVETPEPAMLALVGAGLVGLIVIRRQKHSS